MENALSCWLTERNCPYSNGVDAASRLEWGPDWSNRICARVCRLDQATAAVREVGLSAAEDKAAARALHLSIMAFALQWSQNLDTNDDTCATTAPMAQNERSMRREVWNQARHALQCLSGMKSFRIVFANIIFSLTQRPLDCEKEVGLEEVLQAGDTTIFLEAALRQLHSYRYQFSLSRGRNQKQSLACTPEKARAAPFENDTSGNPEASLILANSGHRDTLNLLFWLGLMFDTQTAAMHQRPPVVSDEDSEVSLVQSLRSLPDGAQRPLDLDGWNMPSTRNSGNHPTDLWGDYILHKSPNRCDSHKEPRRWPCSYEEAATILSDGAPVKVLLYRRVTQLQTLVYRGAFPERLEEGIRKAVLVYRHWHTTYDRFIRDCIANHITLPPRIQSWYVILAAHWHLGAMLLADVIETIDQRQTSSAAEREAREAVGFVATLRRDNAVAVASLAQCSLYEQGKSVQPRQFHDSLAEAAFLTEPFTVLLINTFVRAGCIFLDLISSFSCSNYGTEDVSLARLQEHCSFCVRALMCLGRKSDLASLVGRTLAASLSFHSGEIFSGGGTAAFVSSEID
ncbi:regulatory protein alcR [Penicillium chermesinum]|uniref:Regulatory protein alcR n=1 Tax=Penicillium chermesinum TaxID=63820 RepID=A0A9W9NZ08_9EURO|nr:regulatory protein alcR [Penicillium chermesinum]KAJ5232368.1 regulatory protein alcR [Penicillium chermesinum]